MGKSRNSDWPAVFFILEGRDGVDAMERGYVRGFDAVAKAELWERWRRGESLKAIGRAFGKPSSSIYFQVAPHGGIRPAPRRRSRLALTLSEREEILRGIAGARSMRSIARLLGRNWLLKVKGINGLLLSEAVCCWSPAAASNRTMKISASIATTLIEPVQRLTSTFTFPLRPQV